MITYHIDRGHSLSDGQTLDLQKPYEDYPKHLEYIKALFPSGKVGMLGKKYTYPNYGDSADNHNYIQETIFELVRQKWFPDMPSRFRSFFSLESIEDVKHWLSFFVNDNATEPIIWEVEVKDVLVLDAYWRDVRNTRTDLDPAHSFYAANQYWSKQHYHESPRLEILSSFPVKVIRKVDLS